MTTLRSRNYYPDFTQGNSVFLRFSSGRGQRTAGWAPRPPPRRSCPEASPGFHQLHVMLQITPVYTPSLPTPGFGSKGWCHWRGPSWIHGEGDGVGEQSRELHHLALKEEITSKALRTRGGASQRKPGTLWVVTPLPHSFLE